MDISTEPPRLPCKHLPLLVEALLKYAGEALVAQFFQKTRQGPHHFNKENGSFEQVPDKFSDL